MKCLTCKKEIVPNGKKGRGKNFCSRDCYNHGSTRKIFQKGNIPFFKGKKRPPRSEEWKKKLSESHKGQKSWNKGQKYPQITGDKHPNWKGGITPLQTQVRMSSQYKLWKKSVFERDDFTCQKTGKRGGDLVAHHINNFAEYPELRFAIDNGITLSDKAHREFHKKYGQKNNTLGQLQEFLPADTPQVQVRSGNIKIMSGNLKI